MIGFCVVQVLVLFALFSCSYCSHDDHKPNSLQLVVALYRHGDRIPVGTGLFGLIYPKDPYINETYFPYGRGQLTNIGKKRMYKLGQLFRKMYGSFLGRLYLPGLVTPMSTNFDRTKCSLQLFLAGLFPPRDTILEWNEKLNWNPIPYNYVPLTDRVHGFPIFDCPKFQQLYEEYRVSPEGKAVENRYKPYFSYISQNSGLIVNKIFDLYGLYYLLTMQEDYGLKLPQWTKRVYPEYLESALGDNHLLFTVTPALNQLNGGFLLKQIIEDIYRVTNGTSDQPKMYLYSNHEHMVASLLGALNLYYSHVPYFSSTVIIELHKVKQNYFVKVWYNPDDTFKFVDFTIPGCKTICPLDDFVGLVEGNLPVDLNACNV